jgi:membrane protein DedA with SNARE-associated domain
MMGIPIMWVGLMFLGSLLSWLLGYYSGAMAVQKKTDKVLAMLVARANQQMDKADQMLKELDDG